MWDSYKRNEGDKEAIVLEDSDRRQRKDAWNPDQQLGYQKGSLSVTWKQAGSLKVFTMHSGSFNSLRWFIEVPDSHGLSLETAAEGMFWLVRVKTGEWITWEKADWTLQVLCNVSPCFPACAACSNAAHKTETTSNGPLQAGKLHYLFSEWFTQFSPSESHITPGTSSSQRRKAEKPIHPWVVQDWSEAQLDLTTDS